MAIWGLILDFSGHPEDCFGCIDSTDVQIFAQTLWTAPEIRTLGKPLSLFSNLIQDVCIVHSYFSRKLWRSRMSRIIHVHEISQRRIVTGCMRGFRSHSQTAAQFSRRSRPLSASVNGHSVCSSSLRNCYASLKLLYFGIY